VTISLRPPPHERGTAPKADSSGLQWIRRRLLLPGAAAKRNFGCRDSLVAVTGTLVGRLGLACGALVILVIAIGSLRGANPVTVAIDSTFRSPSWAHPLGTDNYGRDELARVAAGGRTSLLAAVLVLAIAMTVALLVGTLSGLAGGAVDAILMRANDVILSIPSLVLAMAVIGALGPGFIQLVGALSFSYVASFTRMARAFALTSRQRADVTAARLAGVGWWRTMIGHVLPRVAGQLWVIGTLTLGDIVISIAGLSFLGLGIQPPTAEWGSMLSDSRSAFTLAPWLLLGPGLAIVLTAGAVNLVADALRERASA
jgi:nickel transport system permease protein